MIFVTKPPRVPAASTPTTSSSTMLHVAGRTPPEWRAMATTSSGLISVTVLSDRVAVRSTICEASALRPKSFVALRG